VASEELDGVHEAGVERAGPPHARRAHAALGGELGHEPGAQAERLRAVEVVVVVVVSADDAAQATDHAATAVAAEGVREHAVEPARCRQHPVVVVVRGRGRQERRRGVQRGRRRRARRERRRRRRRGAERRRPRARVVRAVEPELLLLLLLVVVVEGAAVCPGCRRQERESPRAAVDRYPSDRRRHRRAPSAGAG